nr:zinc finger, CCHC-type [Tanacetum cinerariifolium]
MLTSYYLLNRIPNKRNKITPYELWTKRKPNLNYLRVWGCKVAVRLPDPKLKTLAERGIKCICVGFVEHFKAFRFYVLEPNDSVAINSIIKLRYAIFDEHRFSSVIRPSQRSLVKGTKDSCSLVVSKRVTDEIVQQSKPELRKSKRHTTLKDFRHEFQLKEQVMRRERFMNYLREQTDDEAMINSIQNGDHPLPIVAQVSLVRTASNAIPTLKDPKFWTAEEKKTQKIDCLARSLLIQGLSNDIYSLIDSNDTAKD